MPAAEGLRHGGGSSHDTDPQSARVFAEALVQAMQSGCDRSGRQFDMVVAALFRVLGYDTPLAVAPDTRGRVRARA